MDSFVVIWQLRLSYQLPQIEFDLFKNSFLNRCLYSYTTILASLTVSCVVIVIFLFCRISLFAVICVFTLYRNVCT